MVLCHRAIYLVIEYNTFWALGSLLPSRLSHRTDSCNTRTCQSFWSLVVPLSSLPSLWYSIVVAFMCHFSLSWSTEARETDRKQIAQVDAGLCCFLAPPLSIVYKSTGKKMLWFQSPKETKAFEKGRWKERLMRKKKEKKRDQQNGACEVTDKRFLKFYDFCLFI